MLNYLSLNKLVLAVLPKLLRFMTIMFNLLRIFPFIKKLLLSASNITKSLNIDFSFISKMLPYLSISTSSLPRALCINEFKDDSSKYLVFNLWKPYKDTGMTYFQKAQIVVDHFHWIRYACNALDKIRIDIQSNSPKSERKYFKHSRSLLLSRQCKIKETMYDELEN